MRECKGVYHLTLVINIIPYILPWSKNISANKKKSLSYKRLIIISKKILSSVLQPDAQYRRPSLHSLWWKISIWKINCKALLNEHISIDKMLKSLNIGINFPTPVKSHLTLEAYYKMKPPGCFCMIPFVSVSQLESERPSRLNTSRVKYFIQISVAKIGGGGGMQWGLSAYCAMGEEKRDSRSVW